MKSFLFASLLSLFSVSAGAQVIYNSSGRPADDRPRRNGPAAVASEDKFTDRLVYGGGIQLSVLGGYFAGGVSPVLGYRITDHLFAGVGLGYRYVRWRDALGPIQNLQTGQVEQNPLTIHLYQPSVWARAVVWRNFFIHGEAEYSIQQWRYKDLDRDITSPTYAEPVRVSNSFTAPSLLVGPGLRQPISNRASLVTMLLFEVLNREFTPYPRGPNLTFGFNVGF